MKSWIFLFPVAVLTIFTTIFAQGGKDYGQFAPPGAYVKGSPFPYYGSENEWSRRMFSQKATDRFYKRRGQRQLLAVLDGHPELAVKLCEKRLEENPDDLESLFVLTIARTQQGQLPEAFRLMKRAIAAGLPFERFLAGPRGLLKPLTESPKFKQFAAKHPVQLLHGPMLGSVSDSSAAFWVRTKNEITVTVNVYAVNDTRHPFQSASAQTRAADDYTTVVKISGLLPNTRYLYDLVLGNKSIFYPYYPAFFTYPEKTTGSRFQIGFGGGAGYTPQYERMWDVIASHHLSAFLLLGDNVYIDLPEKPGAFHDYTYYRRQSRPEFRRLIRTTSIYAIWDDHDLAIDDVWMGPYRDKPVWKEPMWELFRRNWVNPSYGDLEWKGCWYDFNIGEVDFFMLDCRYYRTNPFAESPTMLGRVQKEWLFGELKKSRAKFKVIVSSVPWAFGAKPDSRDPWNGFREERNEIFQFLTENQVKGVILLSADRHRSDIWKIDRQNDYPLYEFESSKLTNIHTHEIVPGALFGYNQKCSFGKLSFDTTQGDPEVTFEIINIDNEPVHKIRLRLSQLQ